MEELLNNQIERLEEAQFLILYWAAQAETLNIKYNITNVFDDLKDLKITRTKQSATSYIEGLYMLCFINVVEESNRKNIYISEYGAEALERLVNSKKVKVQSSRFLEVNK